jgi:hypothetical protein
MSREELESKIYDVLLNNQYSSKPLVDIMNWVDEYTKPKNNKTRNNTEIIVRKTKYNNPTS